MKEALDIIQKLGKKYGNMRVLQDFIEIASIDIIAPFYDRQDRRKSLCEHYSKEELALMQRLFFFVLDELEKQPRDVMGEIYQNLNLQNKQMGQCFTPKSIGYLSSRMTLPTEADIQQKINETGFLRFYEPSCGSGMLIIEFCNYLRKLGFDPQTQLVVYAQDLDIKGVLMCHLQLSLLGIPAIITQGDSLTQDNTAYYGTPFYYLQRKRFINYG